MSKFTLLRSGMAPLRFDGELLRQADSQGSSGQDRTRWHELAVYRTAGGKYVVAIGWRTRYQAELDHNDALVLDTAGEVSCALAGYDSLAHLVGYPLGEHYAEKQERLRADLRARWKAMVSDVLAGDEFAVNADESAEPPAVARVVVHDLDGRENITEYPTLREAFARGHELEAVGGAEMYSVDARDMSGVWRTMGTWSRDVQSS